MIDDDAKLCQLVSQYLSEYQYEVVHHGEGTGVVEMIADTNPELVILDVMLPGKNGIDILRDIRNSSGIPVIMLTAKGSETDRIVGLELGADDYISKPFNSRELLARIKAVLRRAESVKDLSGPPQGSHRINAAGLELDPSTMKLQCGKKSMELSRTEYSILELLMSNPNTVLSRDAIMNSARGKDFIAFDRSIDVQISRLRAKVENLCGDRNRIKTVWGTGYMFVS
jgi:two-component system phosphate regulon response regulator OmpR